MPGECFFVPVEGFFFYVTMSSASESDHDVPGPSQGKKKVRNPDNWKKNVAKRLRNLEKSTQA